MGNICNQQELFVQNLKDAGCNDQMVQTCVKMYQASQLDTLQSLLKIHRKELLQQLHHVQYEIDCLDYLQIQFRK